MIYEKDQAAGALDAARCQEGTARIDAWARWPAYDLGTGTDAQLAAFRLMASPPVDDLSQSFAAGNARRTLAALWEIAAPPGFVDLLTYDAPSGEVARSPCAEGHASHIAALLLSIGAVAEGLSERDLATVDAKVQAALAGLGESGAMARLYTYARRAHHMTALEPELLAAATSDVGCG